MTVRDGLSEGDPDAATTGDDDTEEYGESVFNVSLGAVDGIGDGFVDGFHVTSTEGE